MLGFCKATSFFRHGFIKTSQEIPAKELKLARNRLKEIQNESA